MTAGPVQPDSTPLAPTPRPGGWTPIPNEVIERGGSEIGPVLVWLYVLLVRIAHPSRECSPSVERLRRAMGRGKHQVLRLIAALVRTGWISIRPNPGRRHTYVLHGPPIGTGSVDATGSTDGTGAKEGTGSADGTTTGSTGATTTGSTGATARKEPPRTTKNQNQAAHAAQVEIPDALASDRFRAAWGEWLTYRRERRLTTSPTTLRRQLVILAAAGEADGAEIIAQSITQGWAGLFPLRTKTNGHTRGIPVGPGQRHPTDRTRDGF